jgi:hypothetical protein
LIGGRLTLLGDERRSTIALVGDVPLVVLTSAILLESLVGLTVLGEMSLRVGLRGGRKCEWQRTTKKGGVKGLLLPAEVHERRQTC